VKIANAGIADAPAVVGTTAYVGTGNSQVYALNLVNGSVRWAVGVPNSVEATPLVDRGRVVVALGNTVFRRYSTKLGWIRGTGANGLMALNAVTGSDEWYAPTQGEIMATPVISGSVIYAVTGASRLIAVNLDTGKREWSLRLKGFDSFSSPVVVGNHLYVATNQYFQAYPARRSTVWSIDLEAHHVAWVRDLAVASGLSDCSIAVDGGRLFVEGVPQVSSDGQGRRVSQRLFALSRTTGRVLWSQSLGRGSLPGLDQQEDGTPLAVGPVIYAGSPASNRVEALAAASGRVLWETRLHTGVMANPILLNRRLLVAGTDGRVMMLNARNGAVMGIDPVNLGALGAASPLVVGDVLVQSTMNGSLAVQRLGY
jgi:outer membrane protein assembly factor BamB